MVLWSEAGNASTWVRDEAAYARDRKRLIPVHLDASEPPLGFRQIQSLRLDANVGRAAQLAHLTEVVRALSSGSAASPVQTAPPRRARRRTVLAVAIVATLATGAAWLASYVRAPDTNPAPVEPVSDRRIAPVGVERPKVSVAVLPFTDMSEKHDQEYLADGMAEEIINRLVKAQDLLVTARTSSFYFKGKATTIRDVARELGVEHVLEGSIRRAGDRLRVTAQLIRANSGYHLWSETYDREFGDVFAVQDEIAGAVAQALQIRMKGGETSQRRGGTQNIEAYELYLRAYNASSTGMAVTGDALSSYEKITTYAQRAIDLDPNYGLAWSTLAWGYIAKGVDGLMNATDAFSRARELAHRALEVSPELADAHLVLQQLHAMVDWDWAAAERENRLALALDPTDQNAYQTAGIVYNALGRWEEAQQQFEMALARDPLNSYLYYCLGKMHYGAGRYAAAEAMFRKQWEMDPSFRWARPYISKAMWAQGKTEAAFRIIDEETDPQVRLMSMANAYYSVGRHAESDAALREQIDGQAEMFPVAIAIAYALRGDTERALHWLEKAYEIRDATLLEIVGEPLLKNIEHDPRYHAFLRKLNIPAT